MPVHAKPGRANLGRTIAMVVGVLVLVGAMAAGILAITGDDEARTPAPAETESQTDALPASLKLPGIP